MSKFRPGHKTNVRHGHSVGVASPEYRCWIDIKRRCLNPAVKYFDYYGGRGVSICARWENSFENFFADVGPRPTPKHTIDRFPNKNGNYEPGNVRWATRQEQIDNRRNTRMITIRGETLSITQACKKFGFNRKLITTRLERGWSPEDAITPARWNRKPENPHA